MKLASLFDGIGGWPLAAVRNGIEPAWASEIEKFPIEVTKVRFPKMKHLGSVTDIDGADIEPVDIITSGSPCQDLSIAGGRKGLEGGRSGLFFESARIVREMRAATGGKFPKFYVWENVPGAFSSNNGRDFLAVLEALTEANLPMPRSGRWANAGMVRSRVCDCAWRTLDAQYWGVAQRRRRIFLVADFRAVCQRRPEVFFEPESMSRHSPQSEGTRQGPAEAAYGCFALAGNTIDRQPQNGVNGKGFQREVSYTLTAMDRHAVAIRERCGREGGGKGLLYVDDIAHTLSTGKDQFVCGFNAQASKAQHIGFKAEQSPALDTSKVPGVLLGTVGALCADDHKGINNQYVNQGKVVVGSLCSHYARSCQDNQAVQSGHVIPQNGVRRLTPLECERLQGLPDNYTMIPHKSCSDSARYKAIGNGMAQPCADFVPSVVRRMAE